MCSSSTSLHPTHPTSGSCRTTKVLSESSHCSAINQQCSDLHGLPLKPLLVKVAPDMTDEQLVHIAQTAKANGADGIVVSNTTVERPPSISSKDTTVFKETGGLSGRPLRERSTAMIATVRQAVGPEWPIIGVGGISCADDAWEKICAGATLVQAYSGFVFRRPCADQSRGSWIKAPEIVSVFDD